MCSKQMFQSRTLSRSSTQYITISSAKNYYSTGLTKNYVFLYPFTELPGCLKGGTMLCSRRCLSSPPLTLVAAILFFILVMTKHAKDIYDRNQKIYRMNNYNEFANDVQDSISNLENEVNKTAMSLHRLTDALRMQNEISKKLKDRANIR